MRNFHHLWDNHFCRKHLLRRASQPLKPKTWTCNIPPLSFPSLDGACKDNNLQNVLPRANRATCIL
ncbi:hypothetical protein LguiA_029353 [Lonicera macranthoides]